MSEGGAAGPIRDPSEGVTPIQKAIPGEPQMPEELPTKQFAPFMEGEAPGTSKAPQEEVPSPMQLASGGQGAGQDLTPETLGAHIDRLQGKIGDLQNELTPARYQELTNGQKTLLHSKLVQFNNKMQNLSDLAGTEYQSPKGMGQIPKSVDTYINWLTQGQTQIANAWQMLQPDKAGKISVANMFRVHAVIAGAERAINFASAVAGKMTDFIKQIMSTQL